MFLGLTKPLSRQPVCHSLSPIYLIFAQAASQPFLSLQPKPQQDSELRFYGSLERGRAGILRSGDTDRPGAAKAPYGLFPPSREKQRLEGEGLILPLPLFLLPGAEIPQPSPAEQVRGAPFLPLFPFYQTPRWAKEGKQNEM